MGIGLKIAGFLLAVLVWGGQDYLISKAMADGIGSSSSGDGRLDLFQIGSQSILDLADSTVALMREQNLRLRSDGRYDVMGRIWGSDQNLCSTEPFRGQISAAFCSGSLVAPDTILTAGHCVASQEDCSTMSFVFGFAIKKAENPPASVSASDVYRCQELIHREDTDTGIDFALVRLNKPVLGRSPLPVLQKGLSSLKKEDELIVIGNPSGLPTKIAGGKVLDATSREYFVTDLPASGGNSGSAVFNRATGHIEGVLVRGGEDFVQVPTSSAGSCLQSTQCSGANCVGEDVTRISQVLPYLGYDSTASAPASALETVTLTISASEIETTPSFPQIPGQLLMQLQRMLSDPDNQEGSAEEAGVLHYSLSRRKAVWSL